MRRIWLIGVGSAWLLACTEVGVVLEPPGAATPGVYVGPEQRLSAGQNHACMVEQGALYCWGVNGNGQLGTGNIVNANRPQRVGTAQNWARPVAGSKSSCALTSGGDVYCWGANDHGQLGQGDTTERHLPTRVSTPQPAKALALSNAHVCAIFADDSLWCWGTNSEGQLGQNDTYPGADELRPVRVGKERDWTSIATGDGHSCGLRAAAALYCWGRNGIGELGLGPGVAIQIRIPTLVAKDSSWQLLRAGQNHTCGIQADGSLWCWGTGDAGQLGTGDLNGRKQPTRIRKDSDWSWVSVTALHSCGIRKPGLAYCWGRNIEGQLGLGTTTDSPSPTAAPGLSDATQIETGRFFTCLRRSNGTTSCTGENDSGQLGLGTLARTSLFTPIVARP